jgi:hypothetical protein
MIQKNCLEIIQLNYLTKNESSVTIINEDNFSILNTRKLITLKNGRLSLGSCINATDKLNGKFKSKTEDFSLGSVELENGEILEYFIETCKASMIMIQGVKTMIQIQP